MSNRRADGKASKHVWCFPLNLQEKDYRNLLFGHFSCLKFIFLCAFQNCRTLIKHRQARYLRERKQCSHENLPKHLEGAQFWRLGGKRVDARPSSQPSQNPGQGFLPTFLPSLNGNSFIYFSFLLTFRSYRFLRKVPQGQILPETPTFFPGQIHLFTGLPQKWRHQFMPQRTKSWPRYKGRRAFRSLKGLQDSMGVQWAPLVIQSVQFFLVWLLGSLNHLSWLQNWVKLLGKSPLSSNIG